MGRYTLPKCRRGSVTVSRGLGEFVGGHVRGGGGPIWDRVVVEVQAHGAVRGHAPLHENPPLLHAALLPQALVLLHLRLRLPLSS
jgi:hypothetical protein